MAESKKVLVHCLTVDVTAGLEEEVWPTVEHLCNFCSNVAGDQTDFGTSSQVWAANTDRDIIGQLAEYLYNEVDIARGYLSIETVFISEAEYEQWKDREAKR